MNLDKALGLPPGLEYTVVVRLLLSSRSHTKSARWSKHGDIKRLPFVSWCHKQRRVTQCAKQCPCRVHTLYNGRARASNLGTHTDTHLYTKTTNRVINFKLFWGSNDGVCISSRANTKGLNRHTAHYDVFFYQDGFCHEFVVANFSICSKMFHRTDGRTIANCWVTICHYYPGKVCCLSTSAPSQKSFTRLPQNTHSKLCLRFRRHFICNYLILTFRSWRCTSTT